MPLDDLVSVIETLQQRIKEHGHALNETQTRTALIDPLLTALGWDVSDPGIVTPEYRTDVGWADYALRGPGNKPAAVVEAKRLGSFVENHLDQAVTYCIQQGTAYAAVTDGNHWQMYRTFEPVPLLDKRVLDVQIGNTPAFECALKFLLLWRPNLASGRPVEAKEPILAGVLPAATVAEPVVSPSLTTPAPLPGEGWTSLDKFQPSKGKNPPSAIRLPDGEEKPIAHWWHILSEVAEWHIRTGKLTSDRHPIGNGRTRYIINFEPNHSDGKDFAASRPLSNGLFLEAHRRATYSVDKAIFLLQHFGEHPASVYLKLN